MDGNKAEFLRAFFDQIETQVQFGDNKASLLVAGDAILLAINGGLLKMVSGCQKDEFTVACMEPSGMLALATTAALLLIASLACALWAARPARIHDNPPSEFFLLSHVARVGVDKFVQSYRAASFDDLADAALLAIQQKAAYATQKFRWLKYAVHGTLLSLVFLMMTAIAAAVSVVF